MKISVNIILIVLVFCLTAMGQEIRDAYNATSSYDINVYNKVTDKESGKVHKELKTKSRVYYDESNDFVILEELDVNTNEALEVTIIDFKNGTHILLKDKSDKTAIIKSYSSPIIPSHLKKEYDLQMGKEEKHSGLNVKSAKYIVKDQHLEQVDLKLSPSIVAPSYLDWMPLLHDDLAGHFPVKTEYRSEGKDGIMTETMIEASEFKHENPFHIATFDLNIKK